MGVGSIERIGKFRIEKEIGRGSMATVYLAHDPFMSRNVAIKITDIRDVTDEKVRTRLIDLFYNEARIYGMLDNSYILPVYDAGEEDSLLYLVMEYVEDSRTIQDYCRKDNLLPVARVIDIIYRCCRGLQYAHSKNVIHLDIKPGNILVTRDGFIKIADFGIAMMIQSDEDRVYLEKAVGTPAYMSPEQLRKEPLNHQTDLYSLGAVMFTLLTGELPFRDPDLTRLIKKIIREEPPSLNYYREDIPDILEPIVGKAMQKDLERRYKSASEFASDLLLAGQKLTYSANYADLDKRERLSRMKKVDFFKDFYEKEMMEIMEAGEWIEEEAGQWLISEGDMDDSFYIIIDGEVRIYKGKDAVAAMKPGDGFGQLAYAPIKERTVSIGASTDIVLLKINKEMMERTSINCQFKFLRTFLSALLERLSRRQGN